MSTQTKVTLSKKSNFSNSIKRCSLVEQMICITHLNQLFYKVFELLGIFINLHIKLSSSIGKRIMQHGQREDGEFLITISNKQNEVIKYINGQHQIKCQKIINLHRSKDRELISLYRMQLDRVNDYLQRRQQLNSQLSISTYMQIIQLTDTQNLLFKINTQYCQYPNLQDFLKKESIYPQTQIARDRKTLLFFIQEFLQIILRAGGIDFFFYTPRNLFIISSKSDFYELKCNRLLVNFTSMAGNKLFLSNKAIYRQDLWQIYALIPPNFYELSTQGMTLQLNNIFKKRALGFLIICFIIKKVPNLIDINKLQILVHPDKIKQLLQNSARMFGKIIKLFEKAFSEAREQTGIDFIQLIKQIFILPYEKPNAGSKLISWQQIYYYLFPKQSNMKVQIANAQKYFNRMIGNIWKSQKQQQYFTQRQFGLKQTLGSELFSNQMIYFLTKFNCSFHKILKYPNPCMLIMNEHFSEDVNQIIVKLIRLLNQQQALVQVIKEEEQMDDMAVKGHLQGQNVDMNQEFNQQCFNPFLSKNKQQVEAIKKQIAYQGKVDSSFQYGLSIPQFTNSAYSFEYYDKQSNKMVLSVSSKQVMMSQFCSSLWKI